MKIQLLKFLLLMLTFVNCGKKIKTDFNHKSSNELINETSPYLLQHAYNPVKWKAWNEATLAQANKENKLIIISIGYAACHWCHVMEKESFEDSLVAQTMNTNFINIKVDREERPDVDHVYMTAVQLITGNGGWPLNVVALPDGRPIWGGTYFEKEQWLDILNQISTKFKNNPQEFYNYASKLEEGINSLGLVIQNTEKVAFSNQVIENEINKWKTNFDTIYGGSAEVPKFMMPNNYQFLLRYAYQNNDKELQKNVENTLTKMAFGGLYDQIEGGFSRYSTDKKWHIPHFEKMLYDNAQLVSLYSNAYSHNKMPLYKEVVFETLDFIEKNLTSPEGAFYSSLDADSYNSENILEEGAYYVWKKEELKEILKSEYKLFSKYYNINSYGLWENDNYVLIKNVDDATFSIKNNILLSDLKHKKEKWKNILLRSKAARKKPRLDDKTLTSWNALMLKAYLDAYTTFNHKKYLDVALKNADFILKTQMATNGKLFRNYKDGKSTINGYLEDYANTIAAFIKLYQITSNELWLNKANELTEYSIINFYNDANKMFYYTSKEDPALISKTIEYRDNVIASSNSIMAHNLYLLSHYLENKTYNAMAKSMLNNVKPEIIDNGSYFSNWLNLMLNYTKPFYEIAIVGKDAKQQFKELNAMYLPNTLIIYSETENNTPLLKNRFIEGETNIYVCVNNSCKLPVKTVEKALQLLKK
ncbi:MAG: thioredoxin domain-containing protein [Polaribacter sp.]|nr:thioredoxin domain-containing protein [Polaribacter sp.]